MNGSTKPRAELMHVVFGFGKDAMNQRAYCAFGVPIESDGSQAPLERWMLLGTLAEGASLNAPDLCQKWRLLMVELVKQAVQATSDLDVHVEEVGVPPNGRIH